MNDLSNLPPSYPTVPQQVYAEIKLVKLARELAMDIKELDDILRDHNLTQQQFDEIKENPYFVGVLSEQRTAWLSASNTNERVKLKASAMLEEWLPELYTRMNDKTENLTSKIEGAKLAERLAGMGAGAAKDAGVSDRVSITINLGADNKLEFNKKLPPKVIEHEAPVYADPD